MLLSQWKDFLWQCTKINFIFLLVTSFFLLFSEQIYIIHQYFYSGSVDSFKNLLYAIVGGYKLLWIFFNVVPYIALRQMAKQE